MRLALLVGARGSDVKSKLINRKDNLNIDIYNNVPEFIKLSAKKNAVYDRVLLLSGILKPAEISQLKGYWDEYRDTVMVFLCKKGAQETLAESIMQKFMSVNVAVMLVTSTDVNTLAESILLDPSEISRRYGITKYFDSDTIDDEFAVEEQVTENDEPEVEETVKPMEQPKQEQPEKKKGGFFGLFGSKPKKKEENSTTKHGTPTQQITAEEPIGKEPIADSFSADDFNVEEEPKVSEEPKKSDDLDLSDFNVDDASEDFSETHAKTSRSHFSEEVDDVFADSSDVVDDFEIPDIEPDHSDTETPVPISTRPAKADFKPVKNEPNDFEPEVDDFTFSAMPKEIINDDSKVSKKVDEVEEVEDLLFDTDAAKAESVYRESTKAQPVKVIVKDVVKTVQVEGDGTKSTALKKVLSGQLKRSIIVTGDRATGVTLTAYNLARKFAEYVPVLYVDLDTDTHGLLNYIDYSQYCTYEESQKHAIKFCRNAKLLDSCVVRFDNNFDILGSDFSSEIEPKNIIDAGIAVADSINKYNIVIIDCPVDKLEYIQDLVLISDNIICVEGSKRGFMNMLCKFEASKLDVRYKRTLVNKGTMLITKCNPKMDLNKLIAHIKDLFIADEIDWLEMDWAKFDGKFSTNLLNSILER